MTKARDLGDNAQNTKPKVVNAKADLIVGTGSDAADRLAVGSNGDTLVADSSATTGLRWQGNFAAGKNKIINGGFDIWQRGTSFSNPANNAFTADRFAISYDGAITTHTVSQQTFTPGSAPVAGYEGQYFWRWAVTTNSTATYRFVYQRMEDVRTLAGQTATVSFWIKADSNRTLSDVVYQQNFGSGGSATVQGSITMNTTAITSSWQRVTGTVTFPSVSGKTIGTSSFLLLWIQFPVAGTFDIWGVQIEAGNVATAFQTATGTLAGELAACQRYYERCVARSAFGRFPGGGIGPNTTQGYHVLPFKVRKRIAISSIDYGGSIWSYDGTNPTVTSLAIDQAGDDAVSLSVVGANYTANRFFVLLANNDANAYIGFNAEL